MIDWTYVLICSIFGFGVGFSFFIPYILEELREINNLKKEIESYFEEFENTYNEG